MCVRKERKIKAPRSADHKATCMLAASAAFRFVRLASSDKDGAIKMGERKKPARDTDEHTRTAKSRRN